MIYLAYIYTYIMRNTIKITTEAKKELEWLKATFSFPNFSVAIESAALFFQNNKVNPKHILINNYSEIILEFKKDMTEHFTKLENIENSNSERIIKINRRIEEDYIKPINKKLIVLQNMAIDKYNSESNQLLLKNSDSKNNNNSDLLKIEELNKNSLLQEKAIKEYTNIIDKQDLKLKEYHRCLKTLNENMVAEKGFNSKLIINLPKEKAEELFYLIP